MQNKNIQKEYVKETYGIWVVYRIVGDLQEPPSFMFMFDKNVIKIIETVEVRFTLNGG